MQDWYRLVRNTYSSRNLRKARNGHTFLSYHYRLLNAFTLITKLGGLNHNQISNPKTHPNGQYYQIAEGSADLQLFREKTLIIEKNPYPGGYSTAYEKEGYVFKTTQLFPDIVDILDYLGLEIRLKPYEKDFMRRIVVDGDRVEEYRIPAGAENFKAYLIEKFPGDADRIRALMDYSVDMFRQVRKLKANSRLRKWWPI